MNNKKKLKILFICQISKPINGSQKISNFLLKNLKEKYDYKIDYLDTNLVSENNQVGNFSLKKIIMFSLQLFNLIKKSNNYDVFYIVPGNSFFGILRFYLIIKFLNILKKKIIIHHHGYAIIDFLKKNNEFKKTFLKKQNINLLLTNDMKKKILKIKKNANLIVLKNFSFLESFNSTKLNKKITCLYLSSLMEEKGFVNFIKASKYFKNCNFIICGAGNVKSLNLINRYNKFNNLFYYGEVKGIEKKKIYRKSDIYILQTHYKTEGVPLSLLDAMASSCAIITTSHNGIPETLGKSAIYVKKKSLESLVSSIKKLVKKPELISKYKSCSFREYKKNNYNKEDYLKIINDVFSNRI